MSYERMRVLVNGFPKSGTHAALRAVHLLEAGTSTVHGHLAPQDAIAMPPQL